MKELINIIEKKIAKYNKQIILNENNTEIFSSIIKKFNDSYLPSITMEEANEIRKNMDLTIDESNLLALLQSITDENRNIILSLGLDSNQKDIIEQFKKKINELAMKYSKASIDDIYTNLKIYKNLLSKLNNNDINLITELDVIYRLIEENNFEYRQIIDILRKVNGMNSRIYANYANNDKSDINLSQEDDICEDNLISYNNDREKIISLFKKYNIDFMNFDENLQNNILNLGNYDEMNKILSCVLNHNDLLGFLNLKEYEQILYRTLLFSSEEKINEVIESALKNNVSQIFKIYPTILYPTIKDKSIRTKRNIGGFPHKSFEKTGALNYYLENVKILEEIGYPIDLAFKKCSSFFIQNSKKVRENLAYLKMYNISIYNEDGSFKSFLSTLKSDNLIDNIDISIENGTYEYCKQNLSRLGWDIIPYRVKCNEKLKRNHDLRAIDNPFIIFKNKTEKLALKLPFYQTNSEIFGKTKEDVFALYDAINHGNDETIIYDELVRLGNIDNISTIALDDEYIMYLENNYKENEYMYNINGVIVSRYKVLRYYSSLIKQDDINPSEDLIMYVVTLNSMLDQEELNNVYQNIHKITEKRLQMA